MDSGSSRTSPEVPQWLPERSACCSNELPDGCFQVPRSMPAAVMHGVLILPCATVLQRSVGHLP